jgi:hypothetical protein
VEIEAAIEVEEEIFRMTKMKGVDIEEEGEAIMIGEGEAIMIGEIERGEEGIVEDVDGEIIIRRQMTKKLLETIMLK